MAETVYLLCALTSVMCALLLFRGYKQSRTRLLFWSSLCFAGLAINNMLLFVDLVVLPEIDLRTLRGTTAFVALSLLIIGLIEEAQQ